MTIMAFAEAGKSSFDEVYLAEEDGFELVADEILGRGVGGKFFYCTDDSYFTSAWDYSGDRTRRYLLMYSIAKYLCAQRPQLLLQ
jgi:hypothetical protein